MNTDFAEAIRAGRWADAERLLDRSAHPVVRHGDSPSPAPSPFQGEGWGEVSPSPAPSPFQGEGWGEVSSSPLNALLPTGETLLQLAVEARYPAFLRRLLDAGADPNVVNVDGDSPLIVSCRGDFAVETGILLEGGADPNYRSPSGWTALRCAAKDRNYAAVRILLRKDATIPEASTAESWASALDAFARAVAEE